MSNITGRVYLIASLFALFCVNQKAVFSQSERGWLPLDVKEAYSHAVYNTDTSKYPELRLLTVTFSYGSVSNRDTVFIDAVVDSTGRVRHEWNGRAFDWLFKYSYTGRHQDSILYVVVTRDSSSGLLEYYSTVGRADLYPTEYDSAIVDPNWISSTQLARLPRLKNLYCWGCLMYQYGSLVFIKATLHIAKQTPKDSSRAQLMAVWTYGADDITWYNFDAYTGDFLSGGSASGMEEEEVRSKASSSYLVFKDVSSFLRVKELENVTCVDIYSIAGELVDSVNVENGSLIYNVARSSSGTYLLRLRSNDDVNYKMLVVR